MWVVVTGRISPGGGGGLWSLTVKSWVRIYFKTGATEADSVAWAPVVNAAILIQYLPLHAIMLLKKAGAVFLLLVMNRQVSTQVPSEANQAVPPTYASVPTQKNPSVPTQNNPSVLPQTNPSVLPQNNPSVLPQTNPSVLPQTNPSVLPQTNPSVLPQTNPNLPPPASRRIRVVPLQVNPYFIPYFQDSANRITLPPQASRFWNFGRPTPHLNYRNPNRRLFSNPALSFFAMNELFDFL
ncbi:circumsporozoite protein-like [Haliotis cracherodii]|uniref:circumsporozoite protein-like n=1 Tax=Haliotis cracherodii TaxID=6455 RepID=UPI0039EA14ED